MLCGLKADKDTCVPQSDIDNFCKRNKISNSVICSSKNGDGLGAIFEHLDFKQQEVVSLDTSKVKKSGCC